MTRYIVGILIAIGLIVLVFILILKSFGSHSVPPKPINLNDYASTDAIMRLTIDGPVVADQDHRQARISVDRTQAKIEVIQGYQNNVIRSKTYPNNEDAFTIFVHALKIAGYTLGDPKATKDERGFCPTGDRYIYEILSNSESIQRWWFSSCSLGNFKGRTSTINTLFRTQSSDYSKQLEGVNIP